MTLFSRCFQIKYIMVAITAILTIVLLPAMGQCQIWKTTARFVVLTPDARGKSLGDGGSVFSRGACSAYYNPALLVTSREISAEYNICKYAPDFIGDLPLIKNLYLSSNYKDLIYLGMGYNRFSYGKSVYVDEFGNTIREYEPYDYSLGLWAALAFDENNAVGIGVKYLKSVWGFGGIGSQSIEGSSTALEFGLITRNHLTETTWRNEDINYPNHHRLFRPERDGGFSFGISIANLGEGMKFFDYDDPDPIPRKLRIGFGYQAIDSEPVGLQFTIDATNILVGESETAWSFGIETDIYYLFRFRLGRLDDYDQHLRYNTIGFGLGPEWLCVDYSQILGEPDDWNPRAGEYSYSIKCNISPEIIERF